MTLKLIALVVLIALAAAVVQACVERVTRIYGMTGRLLGVFLLTVLAASALPGTASAAPTLATMANGGLAIDPAARDAAYSAASNAVYAAPDGRGPLVINDPVRIVTNADVLAGSGALATFDPSQAKAFSRLFLLATTAYYRGQTVEISDAGELLWNGLYSSPTAIPALSQAASAVLSAVGASGQPSAIVDQLRAVLVDNFKTLGVTLDLAPTLPSGPIAVSNGTVTIDASFASDGYHAASAVLHDPEPDLTIAMPDKISSGAAAAGAGRPPGDHDRLHPPGRCRTCCVERTHRGPPRRGGGPVRAAQGGQSPSSRDRVERYPRAGDRR